MLNLWNCVVARFFISRGGLKMETDAVDYLEGYLEGKQDGIREVVEWLENNFEPTVPMSLDYRKWHAKLIEWGVDKPKK